jgi:hypothetical protein
VSVSPLSHLKSSPFLPFRQDREQHKHKETRETLPGQFLAFWPPSPIFLLTVTCFSVSSHPCILPVALAMLGGRQSNVHPPFCLESGPTRILE